MKRKHYIYLCGFISILFLFTCNKEKKTLPAPNPTSSIFVLENTPSDYQLRPFVQILEEPIGTKYTIQDITQPAIQAQFQAYPNHTLDLHNYQYYWGKVQIENSLNLKLVFTLISPTNFELR